MRSKVIDRNDNDKKNCDKERGKEAITHYLQIIQFSAEKKNKKKKNGVNKEE